MYWLTPTSARASRAGAEAAAVCGGCGGAFQWAAREGGRRSGELGLVAPVCAAGVRCRSESRARGQWPGGGRSGRGRELGLVTPVCGASGRCRSAPRAVGSRHRWVQEGHRGRRRPRWGHGRREYAGEHHSNIGLVACAGCVLVSLGLWLCHWSLRWGSLTLPLAFASAASDPDSCGNWGPFWRRLLSAGAPVTSVALLGLINKPPHTNTSTKICPGACWGACRGCCGFGCATQAC